MQKTIYDPLIELINYFKNNKNTDFDENIKESNLSIEEKLQKRIINGNKTNIEVDLDEALKQYKPLEIINGILLEGMRVVGELFGSGQMQLPFVLQSAEVMKKAVSHLEKFMDKESAETKGTMVLATVKGDVHDIGKNLVDIILSNNGYTVHNLGIKIGIEEMLEACEKYKPDVLGMSGLLVKSTLIMKENLEVMKERNIDIPVLLGGAALTRRFVENDLREVYGNSVFYAQDAIAGLRFMDDLKTGKIIIDKQSVDLNIKQSQLDIEEELDNATGSDSKILTFGNNGQTKSNVEELAEIPNPPFWGTKVEDSIELDDIYPYMNKTALFRGQWQFRKKGKSDEEFNLIINEKAEPVFERLKNQIKFKHLLEPKVIYSFFPCNSDGEDLIIYKPKDIAEEKINDVWTELNYNLADFEEWKRFTFPRQIGKKNLCISDYFKPIESGIFDVIAMQIVTVGDIASKHSKELFDTDQYSEYLYFHGFSVEAAEALAELWHKKVRGYLDIDKEDAIEINKLFQQGYRGSRYSFGYPACPNLADEIKFFELLKPERIGLRLTDGYQITPEQSTSAIIVHHPQAKYFFL